MSFNKESAIIVVMGNGVRILSSGQDRCGASVLTFKSRRCIKNKLKATNNITPKIENIEEWEEIGWR